MKIANDNQLNEARKEKLTNINVSIDENTPTGQWHPIDFGSGPVTLPHGGTLTIDNAISIREGETGVMIMQYRVTRGGICEGRVITALRQEATSHGITLPPEAFQ